jgi:hypothetical protein
VDERRLSTISVDFPVDNAQAGDTRISEFRNLGQVDQSLIAASDCEKTMAYRHGVVPWPENCGRRVRRRSDVHKPVSRPQNGPRVNHGMERALMSPNADAWRETRR